MTKLIVFIVMLSLTEHCIAQIMPVLATEQVNIAVDPLAAKVLPEDAAMPEGTNATVLASPLTNKKETGNALATSGLSPARSIIKVLGALMVVLLVIVVVAGLLKRTGFTALKRGKQLVLRETLNVGAKERLVVVDFAGESLLIGVASGKVNLVKAVPMLGFDSSELPSPHLGAKTAMDFQHKLNEFLLKGQK